MNNATHFYKIFHRCIQAYHGQQAPIALRVDTPLDNPFAAGTLDNLLYHKNWIDNVQWDLEDLIRDPAIAPEKALQIKRRIDASNQQRTDMVEKIDDRFLETYSNVSPPADARLNTESIAWALDRLSILALKIYHMGLQVQREDADAVHREKCGSKLGVLNVQREDLIRAIDELLEDISSGKRIIKVYRQMKMYNDPSLNPVLYSQKTGE